MVVKTSESDADSASSIKPSMPTHTPGLLDSTYARKKKALMQLINNIRSTGAAMDVDLPTIVVAGNQSSGKSSLIEAISGVKLPRAMGTCTRVPTEVRLRHEENKQWQCAVKIRWEDDTYGVTLGEGQRPERAFGALITDPANVTEMVRRAQTAILNPSIPQDKFLDYLVPENGGLRPLGSTHTFSFSRSVVVLEIAGSNVADLTLVDLPGKISSVDKGGDKNDIKLVEGLINEYIRRDCLILLVLNMMDDAQNQGARELAEEVDPTGSRTIGVLTKADKVEGRELEPWLTRLRNDGREVLSYFVTRQPNADELHAGISFEDARANETNFFANNQPWNTLPLNLLGKLGTKKLSESLSNQLLHFIQQRLPAMREQIHTKHGQLSTELNALGKEPSPDPASDLHKLVTTLTDEIDRHVRGDSGVESFIQKVKVAQGTYMESVRATAPHFQPFTVDELSEGKHKQRAAQAQLAALKDFIDPAGRKGKVMNITDVAKHINDAITRELPNNVPFASKVRLINQCTATWLDISLDLLASVQPMLDDLVNKLIKDVFDRYTEGGLPGVVNSIVKDRIVALNNNTAGFIEKLVLWEARPFTMNDHYYTSVRTKLLGHWNEERHPSSKADDDEHEQKVLDALACLSQIGYVVKEEDLEKLRSGGDYSTELEVMAETRAYWQVAFKRIIDNIPRLIDAEFLIPAADDIRDTLVKELRIFADKERCRGYLVEAPEQARLRDDLKQRVARLSDAKDELRKFSCL